MIDHKTRLILATLAAEAVFDGCNSARASYEQGQLTEKAIIEYSGLGTAEVPPRLKTLENQGYVKSYDTGHFGYGDQWVEGVVVWRPTRAGLVYLWTYS